MSGARINFLPLAISASIRFGIAEFPAGLFDKWLKVIGDEIASFVRISMSSISIGMMSLIENTRGTVSRCVSGEDERFGK